jgi:hypothetical protein
MAGLRASFQLLFVINATFEQEKPDDSIKNHLQRKTCLTLTHISLGTQALARSISN